MKPSDSHYQTKAKRNATLWMVIFFFFEAFIRFLVGIMTSSLHSGLWLSFFFCFIGKNTKLLRWSVIHHRWKSITAKKLLAKLQNFAKLKNLKRFSTFLKNQNFLIIRMFWNEWMTLLGVVHKFRNSTCSKWMQNNKFYDGKSFERSFKPSFGFLWLFFVIS